MAYSLNEIQVIGNVGKDPEQRFTKNDDPVVHFSVATSENWTDKQGQKQERTTWHDIVCHNKGLCKVIMSYVNKGSRVYLKGRLQKRPWEDKDGNKRMNVEIVLGAYNASFGILDSRKDGSGAGDYPDKGYEPGADADAGGMDDEIPF